MFAGLGLSFLTGIIWTAVMIYYSRATDRKDEFSSFMMFGSFFVLIVAYVMNLPVNSSVAEITKLAAIMVPAAFLSTASFATLCMAMQNGSHGVAWGIMQSAILFPFLVGWLFYGEKVGWASSVGMVLILVALIFMVAGKVKRNSEVECGIEKHHKLFVIYIILAFFSSGASQLLTILPNHMNFSVETMKLRIPFFMSGAFLWLLSILIKKQKIAFRQLPNSLVYGCLVFAGQFVLYKAIDAMDELKLTALVYPLAIGSCIVFFTIFCMGYRKEKNTLSEKLGIVILVLGLLLQSFPNK